MASVNQLFSRGSIVVLTAKATITSGDANLIQYTWRKDGLTQSNQLTSGNSTLVTTTPGTYDVVVSHPNADTVTSDSFGLFFRDPEDILRISYKPDGASTYMNFNTGVWENPVSVDWNIATQQYEFGPDAQNGFNSGKSGWWRVFAKEKDLSLDITLRGSSGGGSGGGDGGVSVLRRTFEHRQVYTFRTGDRRTVDGCGIGCSASGDDVSWNAPNGGRVFDNGSNGGGCTYMKRGGSLLAVVGGGGGYSQTGGRGGDGGGCGVGGETGGGSNGGRGGGAVGPGDQIHFPGYPANLGVRRMIRCGATEGASTGGGSLSCTTEVTAIDVQNNGGFSRNGGGAGGSGVEGGQGGGNHQSGGGGGSGWAGGGVTLLSNQLGGNSAPKNGSVRIRQTGFVNYIVHWYHTTGVRRGLTPTFNVINTGNFTASVSPQNVGYTTSDGPDESKHYLITFEEDFSNTNYIIDFTYMGPLQASLNRWHSGWTYTIFDKQKGSFRVKFFSTDDGGNRHINEVIFDVDPA